jgi:hypothetical protein
LVLLFPLLSFFHDLKLGKLVGFILYAQMKKQEVNKKKIKEKERKASEQISSYKNIVRLA